jgi:hypothetical protein
MGSCWGRTERKYGLQRRTKAPVTFLMTPVNFVTCRDARAGVGLAPGARDPDGGARCATAVRHSSSSQQGADQLTPSHTKLRNGTFLADVAVVLGVSCTWDPRRRRFCCCVLRAVCHDISSETFLARYFPATSPVIHHPPGYI